MMKNWKLMVKPAQEGLKPGISNILRLVHHEIHFTRSEISGRSIHVKSFFVFWHYMFNRCTALKCVRCINTCEPAAVFCFLLPIKVVEETRPESAAVGLLFDFLPQSSQRAQRGWLKMLSLGSNLKEWSLVFSDRLPGNSSTMNFAGIVPKLHNVNKSTSLPLGCVKINELNGPGSGIHIRCGQQHLLIYIHKNGVLYRASSQKLVHFAGFFKRVMVLVKICEKGDFPGNPLMDPAAAGFLFYWSLVICHWALGRGFVAMMLNFCLDAWGNGGVGEWGYRRMAAWLHGWWITWGNGGMGGWEKDEGLKG